MSKTHAKHPNLPNLTACGRDSAAVYHVDTDKCDCGVCLKQLQRLAAADDQPPAPAAPATPARRKRPEPEAEIETEAAPRREQLTLRYIDVEMVLQGDASLLVRIVRGLVRGLAG